VRRPSLQWAAYFAACGVMLALTLLVLLQYSAAHWALSTHFRLLSIADLVWPSSFWLLATDGVERALQSRAIVAMSILANGVLYGTVGLVASLLRAGARKAPSARDRTAADAERSARSGPTD
jgi:steroid 5-alpha reductase family enzyme